MSQTPKPPATLWDQFLAQLIWPLVDGDAMKRTRDRIDWDTATRRYTNPSLVYPDYYDRNFHGIQGGYRTIDAAVSYDPITRYVLAPNEDWVRNDAIAAVCGQPRRILDLGCGTGSMTRRLKRAFPQAEVIGIDLAPEMLVMAADLAQRDGLQITWKHGLAEATGLAAASVDLISIALLFHETPPPIAHAVLHEAQRLLTPGGEVVILDGNQASLRGTDWLTQVFEEPYIQDYAQGDVTAWLRSAGFAAIEAQDCWWMHQIVRGVKPIDVTQDITQDASTSADPSDLTPTFA